MRNVDLFVDNLTVIDCSVLDPLHGLSGASWICDIVLAGALDSQSMVMDFGLVKARIKQAIDRLVDHRLLVPQHADSLIEYEASEACVTLTWRDHAGHVLQLSTPAQGVCTLPVPAISRQAVADWLPTLLMPVVGENVDQVRVQLREEAMTGPGYHYSHGLKKHDGNCQRIAHGHRSKLEIWRDGQLAEDLMRQWALDWDHIYVGSREDIVARQTASGQEYLTFAYEADQGRFALQLPAARCRLIEGDSTVETIAAHILAELAAREPNSQFIVKAYEGVSKGAIARNVSP